MPSSKAKTIKKVRATTLAQQSGPSEIRSGSVTLKDVARVAGVSPITVSRALHRPELVQPSTVETVRKAVDLTGYIPNQLAGALTARRTNLIAAIVPQIANSIFVETIQALSDRLWQSNYQLLLGLSGYPDPREDELLLAILSRRPDGVVLTGIGHSPETRRKLMLAGIPVIEIWDLTPTPIDMVIGFSHERIGETTALHMLDKGYRRFGLIWANDERSIARRRGLTNTLQKHGITDIPIDLGPNPSTFQLGREGLARLLNQGHALDAVVCSSDPLAHGAMAEAQSRGLAIPADLAIMGFGDFDFAAYANPSLTTIRIDKRAIGVLAAETLLNRIAGKPLESQVIDVGFKLVERDST
jgi:LacI family gluconate utilization system Gnt-I transcriptional repressor